MATAIDRNRRKAERLFRKAPLPFRLEYLLLKTVGCILRLLFPRADIAEAEAYRVNLTVNGDGTVSAVEEE